MFHRGPEVSICLPNYNNGRYLEKCLSSILAQSFSNFEVVVVDDHSTDNSIDIINSFDDSRIRLHRNKARMGIAKVRNKALALCQADLTTSLDSDDFYYDADKLSAERRLFRQSENSGAPIIAFSDVMRVDKHGKDLFRVSARKEIREGILFAELLARSIFIPRDYLCPTKWLKNVGGYNDHLPIYEDWDLKLRLAQRHAFAFSNLVGIGYRVTGTGLSAMPENEQDEGIALIRSNFKNDYSCVVTKRTIIRRVLDRLQALKERR